VFLFPEARHLTRLRWSERRKKRELVKKTFLFVMETLNIVWSADWILSCPTPPSSPETLVSLRYSFPCAIFALLPLPRPHMKLLHRGCPSQFALGILIICIFARITSTVTLAPVFSSLSIYALALQLPCLMLVPSPFLSWLSYRSQIANILIFILADVHTYHYIYPSMCNLPPPPRLCISACPYPNGLSSIVISRFFSLFMITCFVALCYLHSFIGKECKWSKGRSRLL